MIQKNNNEEDHRSYETLQHIGGKKKLLKKIKKQRKHHRKELINITEKFSRDGRQKNSKCIGRITSYHDRINTIIIIPN